MTEDELMQARDRANEGERLAANIKHLSELSRLIGLEAVRVQVNVQCSEAKIDIYGKDSAGIVAFLGSYTASGWSERLRKALLELVHDDLTEARIAFGEW